MTANTGSKTVHCCKSIGSFEIDMSKQKSKSIIVKSAPVIAESKIPKPTEAILVDVFISYSRKDIVTARKVYELLTAEGFAVWFDEKIYGGSSWEDMLMTHLSAAKCIVVLWTNNSLKSEWVKKEADFALASRRLLPVLLEDCKYPEDWQTLQYVLLDGWEGAGPHPKLEQMLTGISKLAPPSRIDSVRPGFVSDSLGQELGLPSVTGVADEFRYLHFSVVMNPARRLPWYVAANLEAANDEVVRGDKWMPDPLLPGAFQPGNEHYKNTEYNRGHIISPRSVSWGDLREAQIANRQSFFWTNTAPQLSEMNQGWWLKIEEWERELPATYTRAVSFGGPVLRADDPPLGESDRMVGRLRLKQNFLVPQSFWKVCIVVDNGNLLVAGFMLNQAKLSLAKTPFDVDLSTHSATIAAIEKATGLEFCEPIRNANQLRL